MNIQDEYPITQAIELFENTYTARRIASLLSSHGHFCCSIKHLQALHAEIFCDFPKAWVNFECFDELPSEYLEFSPGTFREPAERYNPHMKFRRYGDRDIYTFYSCATAQDFAEVEAQLDALEIARLRERPLPEKIQIIGHCYEMLDFLHPFQDGNSRTVRTFVLQLAEALEVSLNWDCLTAPALFGARDLNLLRRSVGYFDGEAEVRAREGLAFLEKNQCLGLQSLLAQAGVVEEGAPPCAPKLPH